MTLDSAEDEDRPGKSNTGGCAEGGNAAEDGNGAEDASDFCGSEMLLLLMLPVPMSPGESSGPESRTVFRPGDKRSMTLNEPADADVCWGGLGPAGSCDRTVVTFCETAARGEYNMSVITCLDFRFLLF